MKTLSLNLSKQYIIRSLCIIVKYYYENSNLSNIINQRHKMIDAINRYIYSNEKARLILLVIILSALSFNHAFNFHLY